MDLTSLGVIALVLAAACFAMWCNKHSAAAQARVIADVVDRCITFRGVQAPETVALGRLSETVKNQADQLMAFSEEGRDLLRHKEQTREVVKSLEGQLELANKYLEGMGVRAKPPTPAPMPERQIDPEVVEAEFAERTRRDEL